MNQVLELIMGNKLSGCRYLILAILLILRIEFSFAQNSCIELAYTFATNDKLFDNNFQSTFLKTQNINIIYYYKIGDENNNGILWNVGLDLSILKLIIDSKNENNFPTERISELDYKGICSGLNYRLFILKRKQTKLDYQIGANATMLISGDYTIQLVDLRDSLSITVNDINVNYTEDNRLRFSINTGINYIYKFKEKISISVGLKLCVDLNYKRKLDYKFIRNNFLVESGRNNFKNVYVSLPVSVYF